METRRVCAATSCPSNEQSCVWTHLCNTPAHAWEPKNSTSLHYVQYYTCLSTQHYVLDHILPCPCITMYYHVLPNMCLYGLRICMVLCSTATHVHAHGQARSRSTPQLYVSRLQWCPRPCMLLPARRLLTRCLPARPPMRIDYQAVSQP